MAFLWPELFADMLVEKASITRYHEEAFCSSDFHHLLLSNDERAVCL